MLHFKGKIGEDYVEQGDYSISSEDGKYLVQHDDWQSALRTGSVILMSMVIKKIDLHQQREHQSQTCPRCYKTLLGVMTDGGWLKWQVGIFSHNSAYLCG